MNRSVTDSPVQTIGQRGEPLGEVIANVVQFWTGSIGRSPKPGFQAAAWAYRIPRGPPTRAPLTEGRRSLSLVSIESATAATAEVGGALGGQASASAAAAACCAVLQGWVALTATRIGQPIANAAVTSEVAAVIGSEIRILSLRSLISVT
jgi:hypothetical protein